MRSRLYAILDKFLLSKECILFMSIFTFLLMFQTIFTQTQEREKLLNGSSIPLIPVEAIKDTYSSFCSRAAKYSYQQNGAVAGDRCFYWICIAIVSLFLSFVNIAHIVYFHLCILILEYVTIFVNVTCLHSCEFCI